MNIKQIIVIGISIFSIACQAQTLPTEILYSSQQCGIKTQSVKEINQTELNNLYTHFNKFLLPAMSVPKVDFMQSMIILAAIGEKPTLGYNIDLKTDTTSIILNNNQLKLPLTFSQPKTNAINAQIVNSPCILLKTQRIDYSRIQQITYHR